MPHRANRIIPVLIEGEPGAAEAAPSDPVRRAREYLPETLRLGIRAAGPPTPDVLHPIDETAPFCADTLRLSPKGHA